MRGRFDAAVYALPTLPESWASIAVVAVIPGYYASTLTVPAAAVGTALVVSRCADAVIDPAIGYFSDRITAPRYGRKPLILAGAVIMAAGAVSLLAPPAGVGAFYLTLWSFIYFAGWTVYSVPYDSWGAELNSDLEGRNRIFSWRAAFFYAGMGGFFLAPMLPGRSSHAIDAQTLEQNALLVGIGIPTFTLLACAWVPVGIAQQRKPATESVRMTVRSLLQNRPLLLYLVNALISGLGNGMNVSLAYLFVADRLRLADSFALILMANILGNLAALPPWQWVIRKLGKRHSWAMGLLLNAGTMPAFLLLAPGPDALWPMVFLSSLNGATYSVCNVTLPAILADVVDYETWRTGRVRTGSIFATYALVRKFNSAVGSGAAFLLLAAFDYRPGAPTADSAWGLAVTFALLPTALQLVAAAMAATFPIDDQRHAALRRSIQRRLRARENDAEQLRE